MINLPVYWSNRSLANGERLYAFNFEIPSSEMEKLVKETTYTLHPIDNDAKYQWILPNT